MGLADFLLGRPLASDEDEGERVGPLAGVPVLGLDALGSAAYGPEALLTALAPLGSVGLAYASSLTAVVVTVLGVVFLSYRQTIAAYPNGGGAYTVAKENLGSTASLLAAAALALDYVLNVAVAISSGAGAFVSMVPRMQAYTLPLCLGRLLVLTVVNLRGLRATGVAFMAPTYIFLATLLTVMGIGLVKTLAQHGQPWPVVAAPAPVLGATTASTWLLLRAFANGCTAMTGVEAVSNGIPIFREPRTVGARRTLSLIIGLLAVLLVGESILCRSYGITATRPGDPSYRSVLSMLTAAVVGQGWFYHLTMGSVVLLLSLSANTSFADFPRLCRILASDRFLPEAFVHRGRRLAFSVGITVLSVLSGLLLVAFGGITDALIPLFAVGAFLAFTLSQIGMVAHWRRQRASRARGALAINVVGASATGLTLCVVLVSKFSEGAWFSVLLVAGNVAAVFWRSPPLRLRRSNDRDAGRA